MYATKDHENLRKKKKKKGTQDPLVKHFKRVEPKKKIKVTKKRMILINSDDRRNDQENYSY